MLNFYKKKKTLTINRKKMTKQNEAILNPIVSTTIPPATGPNKAPNDQIKLNVAEIRPCVFTSFG